MASAVLFALLAGTVACNGHDPERATLTVLAASSLTDAFQELERTFEAAHPEVDVRLGFAGSQGLRLQIEQGAPADLYASADRAHMEALATAGHVEEPRLFAHNELALIVPAEGGGAIGEVEDLAHAERLVVGDPRSPIGRYTEHFLERARARYGPDFDRAVRAAIASEEANVRLVRAKVELGEADAAIVYATDARASDRVRTIALPEPLRVRTDLMVATVTASPRKRAARQWIEHLTSDRGRRVLEAHGFDPVR